MNIATKVNTTNIKDVFKQYEHFCKVMLDAYVLIDNTGKILKTNALFAQLVGQNIKYILKTNSLDELITFYINNKRLNVNELLEYNFPIRIDEVRGEVNSKKDLNLILGYYPFLQDALLLGAFILIRDVTAETKLQFKYKDTAIKSITDPLTGLYTRAYFEEYLQVQTRVLVNLEDSSPQKKMSFLMIDIDHFKKVNDNYGHQAGDYILKQVASIIKKAFRQTDILCRYGGEEFLIILPSTDLNGAYLAGEKLRKLIEEAKMIFNDELHIPTTISLGAAHYKIGQETYLQAINRADEALYRAKQLGRNKICIEQT